MARTILSIPDIAPYSEGDGVPTPVWYPLYFTKGGPKSGEILLSFALVDDDFTFKVPGPEVNIPMECGIIMKEY